MENLNLNMPVLALRGLTIFPGCFLTFDVEREISIRALERAMESDQKIFLVAQKEIGVNQPGRRICIRWEPFPPFARSCVSARLLSAL